MKRFVAEFFDRHYDDLMITAGLMACWVFVGLFLFVVHLA